MKHLKNLQIHGHRTEFNDDDVKILISQFVLNNYFKFNRKFAYYNVLYMYIFDSYEIYAEIYGGSFGEKVD